MTAKLYRTNAQAKTAKLSGQAKVVMAQLSDTPQLAKDVLAKVKQSGQLKTTQDEYRVVLYYILVFKSKGWVDAVEPVETAEPVETDQPELPLEFETV